jgi:hypothetical protein
MSELGCIFGLRRNVERCPLYPDERMLPNESNMSEKAAKLGRRRAPRVSDPTSARRRAPSKERVMHVGEAAYLDFRSIRR